MRSIIYVFYKLKDLLRDKELKSLYQLIIEPLLHYGTIAWGGGDLSEASEPRRDHTKKVLQNNITSKYIKI